MGPFDFFIMKTYKHRAGFTLIELLVVIAIIGILASILLPVLSRAKKKARTMKSVNNQGQIGKAYVMYLDDNEGWFPRVSGPAGVGSRAPRIATALAGSRRPRARRRSQSRFGAGPSD